MRIEPLKQTDPTYEEISEDEHERIYWREWFEAGHAMPDWVDETERRIAEEERAKLGGKRFDESKHPRDPGGEGGGQFIKKGAVAVDEGAKVNPALLRLPQAKGPTYGGSYNPPAWWTEPYKYGTDGRTNEQVYLSWLTNNGVTQDREGKYLFYFADDGEMPVLEEGQRLWTDEQEARTFVTDNLVVSPSEVSLYELHLNPWEIEVGSGIWASLREPYDTADSVHVPPTSHFAATYSAPEAVEPSMFVPVDPDHMGVNPSYRATIGGEDWYVKDERTMRKSRIYDEIEAGRDSARELAAQEVYREIVAVDPTFSERVEVPEFKRFQMTPPMTYNGETIESTFSGSAATPGVPVLDTGSQWTSRDVFFGPEGVVTDLEAEAAGEMIPDETGRSLALYDQIIGNLDRHAGNAGRDGGKLYAYDNGLSFPEFNDSMSLVEKGPSAELSYGGYGGVDLTPAEKKTVTSIQKRWPKLSKRLSPYLSEKEIAAAKRRIDFLAEGYFISEETAGGMDL